MSSILISSTLAHFFLCWCHFLVRRVLGKSFVGAAPPATIWHQSITPTPAPHPPPSLLLLQFFLQCVRVRRGDVDGRLSWQFAEDRDPAPSRALAEQSSSPKLPIPHDPPHNPQPAHSCPPIEKAKRLALLFISPGCHRTFSAAQRKCCVQQYLLYVTARVRRGEVTPERPETW